MRVISMPESRPQANRPEGKSLCQDGCPLCGSTLLLPWDLVLLHLTFASISAGFVLRTIGSWVGEAANVLTLDKIAFVFKGRQFFESETNLGGCYCNSDRGGGWLMDQEEASFFGEFKWSSSG